MKKAVPIIIMFLAAAIFAQDLPQIAVYITGDMGDNEKRTLGARMLNALIRDGRYTDAERGAAFIADLESERAQQPGGAIGNNAIVEIGKRFDVGYICVIEVTPAFGEYNISARKIDVETATTVSVGEAHSPLRNMSDLTRTVDDLMKSLLSREQARTRPPASAPAPQPEPAAAANVPYAEILSEAQIPLPQSQTGHGAAVAPHRPESAPAPSATQGGGAIGLYITSTGGGVAARAITPIVANGLSRALSSGRFSAANRTEDINRLLGGGADGGNLSGSQIQNIGRQLGIQYLCVVKLNIASGNIGLIIELLNAQTGSTVTTLNLSDLNRNTVAAAMTSIARDLLGSLGGAGDAVAGMGTAQPSVPMPFDPGARIPPPRGSGSNERSGGKVSMGGGVFYSGDYSGGINFTQAREQMVMPYNGVGMYTFLDATYIEFFWGVISGGGGKWKSNNSAAGNLPYMSRSNMNFGTLGKVPVSGAESNPKFSFVAGFDYEMMLSGEIKYSSSSRNIHFNNGELSALWYKFGCELDVDVGRKTYMRFQTLYGVRSANNYEQNSENYGSVETRIGYGLTLKVGVGGRF